MTTATCLQLTFTDGQKRTMLEAAFNVLSLYPKKLFTPKDLWKKIEAHGLADLIKQRPSGARKTPHDSLRAQMPKDVRFKFKKKGNAARTWGLASAKNSNRKKAAVTELELCAQMAQGGKLSEAIRKIIFNGAEGAINCLCSGAYASSKADGELTLKGASYNLFSGVSIKSFTSGWGCQITRHWAGQVFTPNSRIIQPLSMFLGLGSLEYPEVDRIGDEDPRLPRVLKVLKNLETTKALEPELREILRFSWQGPKCKFTPKFVLMSMLEGDEDEAEAEEMETEEVEPEGAEAAKRACWLIPVQSMINLPTHFTVFADDKGHRSLRGCVSVNGKEEVVLYFKRKGGDGKGGSPSQFQVVLNKKGFIAALNKGLIAGAVQVA